MSTRVCRPYAATSSVVRVFTAGCSGLPEVWYELRYVEAMVYICKTMTHNTSAFTNICDIPRKPTRIQREPLELHSKVVWAKAVVASLHS